MAGTFNQSLQCTQDVFLGFQAPSPPVPGNVCSKIYYVAPAISKCSSNIYKTDLGGTVTKPGGLEPPPPYSTVRCLIPIHIRLRTEMHQVLHVKYLECKCLSPLSQSTKHPASTGSSCDLLWPPTLTVTHTSVLAAPALGSLQLSISLHTIPRTILPSPA